MNRKDPKGRVLRKGEGYRKDKNLYIYQYRDPLGGMYSDICCQTHNFERGI